MTLLRGGALAGVVLLAGVVAVGCADRGQGGAAPSVGVGLAAEPTAGPPVTRPPAAEPPAAPTSVPPTGPCQTRFEVAEAAPATTAPPPSTGSGRLPGDLPPNHADNNGWKRRAPLAPAAHAAAVAVAEELRPALERLCGQGDFARESALRVLKGTGRATGEVYARPFELPVTGTTPPAGVVYGVHLGDRACVIGSLSPGQVMIRVDGTTREGSCHEPSSH
ncbi:hypothetical protein [Saccharothrix lopnurensis]|uniref:Uncharacterized protein n=1 Tax=Saccharothrix lopnurensis TaxID=1670621 RepID=A0ABW1P012_9PSEU